jgi:transcriptional regulator with XRE-family HTH domain
MAARPRRRTIGDPTDGGAPGDLPPVIAANLRKLRARHGLSLERLAGQSRVSRAMLGQIELGQSAPTVNVLAKIAIALDVPLSALIGSAHTTANELLPAATAKVLASPSGGFRARALFPGDGARRVEFHELRLAPQIEELVAPRAPGTSGNLIVTEGALEVRVGPETFALGRGDALFFEADRAHVYRNPGAVEACVYLVTSFPCPREG